IAFHGRSIEECEKLEQIGQKIASRCKGLPLAAKCFSYCAIFPKDFNIMKEKLITMWMAQGYFSVEQDEEVDIIGEEYFNILATHSFFQEFKKDDDNLIVACKMHDIVHDFAQFVSQNECSSMEINGSKEHNAINSLDKKVCHLMLIIGEGASFPVSTCRVKRMRSLFIGGNMLDNSSLNGKMLKELFEKLTSLRVLNIGKWSISRWYFILEIPRNIEKLIHLKYLNLSCLTSIRKLPEPLCELYNLEKLDISHCWYLKELPEGIGKLINMKHLLNERTDSLGRMPAGIARLTSLRTFDEFHVSRGKAVDGHKGCNNVFPNWMMSLTNPRSLELILCENCNQLPPLGILPSLEKVIITYMISVKRVGNEFLGIEIIIAFPKLKSLTISWMLELKEWNYGITRTGNAFINIMPRLSSLTIDSCPKLKALPDHFHQTTTLKELIIRSNCGLLEECYRNRGGDWRKISRIPNLEIRP
ncbi:hypothetical protein CISIN_1g0439642mg, partial [Citrus sinensis]